MSPDQDQRHLLDADDLSTAAEPAAPIGVIGVAACNHRAFCSQSSAIRTQIKCE